MRHDKKNSAVRQAVLETLESRRLLSFAAPVSYAVGTNPLGLATADFNGDGRSDVVTANAGSNSVSVRLSNSNGTLQPAQTFATGIRPQSVTVGDVNKDGKTDIITANFGDYGNFGINGGSVGVLLGNGNGTFQPATGVALPPQFPPDDARAIPRGQAPVSVAVGDINGDGKMDLAVNAWASSAVFSCGYYSCGYQDWPVGYVNVLLGNGDGTFETSSTYHHPSTTQSIGLADFNGDNKLDVVTGTGPTVLLGNGDGTLQPAIQSPYSGYAPDLVIGDFDTDGKPDLVVRGGEGLNILKGQGDGTFRVANSVAVSVQATGGGVPGGIAIRSVVTGDVNGDGKLDLVVNTQQTTYESCPYYCYNPTTTDHTQVLLGFGDNTFSLPITSTLRSYAGLPSGNNGTALADLNGDSRPDLIATEPTANAVSVQLNQGGWVAPVAVAIGDATAVTEGHSGTVNTVFTVTLDHAVDFNVSVNYSTADGTATLAGGDFVATSGTLLFAPGQTSKTITVPVKGDRIGEHDEQFYVNLTSATNGHIADGSGAGTILDDEPRVTISGGTAVTEGDSGTKPMLFTATLSAPSDATVTVDYGTGESDARAGKDYLAVTGTVTFLPGQTSRTFEIPIVGDLIPEHDEIFYTNLTAANGALVVEEFSFWRGVIHDNDPDTSIVISNVSRSEGNSSQTLFEFIVSLQTPTEKEVYVNWATANGTASSSGGNKDYESATGSVHFYPGQMTATVYVSVYGDTRNESDETFFVNLSSPFNATIADGQGIGTILNDESRGKKWVGPSTGGSWATAANWSPSGVPTTDSFVTIDGASVTLSSSATVAELSLQNGAALNVASAGNRTFRTSGLHLGGNETLSLNNNDLILDYTGFSAYSLIKDHVITGRRTGTVGILTAAGARDTALAVVDNAQFGRTSWNGQVIDATTIIGKYTFFGDSNLDGKVTGDDYVSIDSNLGSTNAQWFHGDFNFSGSVTGDDYVSIDANLGKGTSDPLAFADDQEAMIELHAAQYGESYVKAVERAAKGKYTTGVTKTGGGKKSFRN